MESEGGLFKAESNFVPVYLVVSVALRVCFLQCQNWLINVSCKIHLSSCLPKLFYNCISNYSRTKIIQLAHVLSFLCPVRNLRLDWIWWCLTLLHGLQCSDAVTGAIN